jgi:hypothetical protein
MARIEGEAFLFYFERWRGSKPVQRLSFAERGMFLEMMIEQWMRGDLPDDAKAVADAIALNDAQVAEVEHAWSALRRLFVSAGKAECRIQNLPLERVRRERQRFLRNQQKSGQRGGKAAAYNRRNGKALSLQRASSDPIPKNGTEQNPTEPNGTEREIAPARPRRASVLDGSLTRDHLGHVFCSEDFAVCVPSAVHAKFIGPLSRKFGGDREQAHAALLAWYATTTSALPSDCVMGDAFRFWQPRFDAAFASQETVTPAFGKQTTRLLAAVENIAREAK